MRAWTGWLLVLCALLPFLSTRQGEEVHDDVVLRGPGSLVTAPQADLGLLWRADMFGTVEQPTGQTGFWRPLVLMTWRAQWWLTDGAPRPFSWLGHVTNLLAHCLATLALAALLLRLGLPAPAALVGAALFGVHPVHAESVAWISGLSDVGATALAWSGTALLLVEPRSRVRLVLATVLLLGGMLFKESVVLLVGLSALLLRLRGHRWRAALSPAGAALLAYAVLRLASFEHGVAEQAWTGPDSPLVRWATWLATIPAFVRLSVWPGPATPLRPVPPVTGLATPEVWIGAGVLGLLLLLGWQAWRRRAPAAVLASLLLSGTLVMLAPWVRFPTGYPEAAAPLYERYLYAAAAAAPVVLAGLFSGLTSPWRRPALLAAALLVLAWMPVTASRAAVWRNDESFARAGLTAAPRSPEMWNHLGVALLERLRQDGSVTAGEEALAAFEQALALQSGHAFASLNRFIALGMLRREGEAALAADRLLHRQPDDPAVLDNVAQWHMLNERWEQAADLLERALATGGARPGATQDLERCLLAMQAESGG